MVEFFLRGPTWVRVLCRVPKLAKNHLVCTYLVEASRGGAGPPLPTYVCVDPGRVASWAGTACLAALLPRALPTTRSWVVAAPCLTLPKLLRARSLTLSTPSTPGEKTRSA